MFTAKIVTPFLGGVRFERETRYNLFLEVDYEEVYINNVHFVPNNMDTPSPSTASIHFTPESVSESTPWPEPLPNHEAGPGLGTPCVNSWLPSYLPTPASKVGEDRKNYPSSNSTSIESPSASCVVREMKGQATTRVSWSREQWDELADLATRRRTAFSDDHQQPRDSGKPPLGAPISTSKTDIAEMVESITEECKNKELVTEIENLTCGALFREDHFGMDLEKHDYTMDQKSSVETGIRAFLQNSFSCKDKPDHYKRSKTRHCAIDPNTEKAVSRARCCSWLEKTTENLGSENLTSLATAANKISPKRKASEHDSAPHINSLHHAPTDNLGDSGCGTVFATRNHLSEELAAKRQRLSERIDSGIGMSEYYSENNGSTDETGVNSNFDISPQHKYKHNKDSDDELLLRVANFTTGRLGEVCTPGSSEDAGGFSWFATLKQGHSNNSKITLKSRAFEVGSGDLKVMPALKKNGSVKRVVFQKRRALNDSLPSTPKPPCSLGPSPINVLSSPAPGQFLTDGPNIPSSTIAQGRWSPQTVLPEIKQSKENIADYVQRRQREIADNYDQALTQRMVKESRGSATFGIDGTMDGDEKAMERIFLARSEGSGEAVNYSSGIEWESESEPSKLMDMALKIEAVERVA